MKKKKTIIFSIIASILVLFLIYFIGTGFRKQTCAYINTYAISEDGKEITINVGVAASIGYIRKAETYKDNDGRLCIDFYSAFGGINGHIGAKTIFTLPLDEDTNIIAIHKSENYYDEVLYKDEDGVWQFMK